MSIVCTFQPIRYLSWLMLEIFTGYGKTSQCHVAGNLLLMAFCTMFKPNTVAVSSAQTAGINHGSSIRKLYWKQSRIESQFSSRFILESIGIAVQVSEGTWLDEILRKFSEAFPATREFSAFARSTLPDVNPQDDQDAALMAWMEREEILFRTFEKYLIEKQLSQGFDDVDGFISFSLSVQNRMTFI